VKLRLPFTRFERELLTELNIAAAQLHPNSWAFVQTSATEKKEVQRGEKAGDQG